MKRQFLSIALFAVFASGATGAWAQSEHKGGHNHAPPTVETSWSTFPLIEPVKGRFSRSEKRVLLNNFESESLEVWASLEGQDLKKAKTISHLQKEGNIFSIQGAGMGGYRYLSAQQKVGDQIISGASTIYFSMPSPAPREMLALPKSKLEVLPVILPREHQHFQENTDWSFMVRFDGVPLSQVKVNFETQNGEKQQFVTDNQGQVKIRFPQDFPEAPIDHGKGHGRRYAQFVVAATHQDNGVKYTSAFNDQYAPGPFSQKSVWAGLGFMVLGMAGALPLWRRKNKKGA